MSKVILELSEKHYTISAIQEALYWLSNKYSLFISPSAVSDVIVFSSESELNQESLKHILQVIHDYQLREKINSETKTLKEIIIAKAFYPDEINVPEPNGDLRDPVFMDQDEAK